VIAAALSVPALECGDPWHYKPLLTDALTGLLPPSITARTTKGSFDADHHQGLRASLPAVLGLADGHLAALGLLEPVLAAEAWRHVIAGDPVRMPAWIEACGQPVGEPASTALRRAHHGRAPRGLPRNIPLHRMKRSRARAGVVCVTATKKIRTPAA